MVTEGSGANAKYYIQVGADAASKKLLGGSYWTKNKALIFNADNNPRATLSITDYPQYKTITIADIFYRVTSMGGWTYAAGWYTESYNPNNGVITFVRNFALDQGQTFNLTFSIALK